MRPINLIPEDERRSHGTTTRTGPLAYLIVGALGVLLIGVVVLVLTNNQISDRQSEVKTLEGERAAAVAKADALAAYVSFQQVAESRTQTITGLADSRFDWVRVIRQLSLILPPEVYLTNLAASAGGGDEAVAGVPSLEIAGCAPGQNTVAVFVAALKEIDGVTRVGLGSSATALNEGGSEGEGGGGSGCQSGGAFNFQITVLFDGAPSSPDSGAGLEVTEVPPEEAPAEGEEAESSTETTEPEPASEGTVSATPAEPAG